MIDFATQDSSRQESMLISEVCSPNCLLYSVGMPYLNRFSFILALLLLLSGSDALAAGKFIEEIAQAVRSEQPWPRLSAGLPDSDTNAAMRLQRQWVEEITAGQPPAGYKLALTSKTTQDRFGVSAPLFGVLPHVARRRSGAEITLAAARKPMLEIEFGWRLARVVSDVPADDESLRAMFDAVVPVVEIPAVAFAGGAPRGIDILATNTAVHVYVVSSFALPDSLDPHGVELQLLYQDQPVSSGLGNQVEGGQLAALRLLLETALVQGWSLEPGQYFLTGALDGLKPAQNGDYALRADGLEMLRFRMDSQ